MEREIGFVTHGLSTKWKGAGVGWKTEARSAGHPAEPDKSSEGSRLLR